MTNNIALPVGFQFSPTDEELLGLFLSQRENLPPFYPIQVADVYADKEPWLLFDKDVQQIHYVFVELKRKTIKSKMAKRACNSVQFGSTNQGAIEKIGNQQEANPTEARRLLQNSAAQSNLLSGDLDIRFNLSNQGAIEEIGNQQKENLTDTEACRSLQPSTAQSNPLSGDVDVQFNFRNQGATEEIGNQQVANATELTESELWRLLQHSVVPCNPLSNDVDVGTLLDTTIDWRPCDNFGDESSIPLDDNVAIQGYQQFIKLHSRINQFNCNLR
ncbi:uncharacterized protein [Euphorbia lathyris]|uniref:uncharacterized protein isoform X1 n=1 Tax=Euphorbia lathyris TaxID=212925 RepID=UPI0033135F16